MRNTALKQRVDEQGYRASDERVTQSIRDIAAFQVDGQFSLDVYRGLLANQGLAPTGFEELQRESLAIGDLERGIVDSTFLTPLEFRRYIELYKRGRLPVDRLMSGTLRLDEINEGFDRLHEGKAIRQVLVL